MRSRTAGMPSGRFSLLPGLAIQARRNRLWSIRSLSQLLVQPRQLGLGLPRKMRHGLLIHARAPAIRPHLRKGSGQIGGRIGLVHEA